MSAIPISVPENSCAYEEYDPKTLEPANDSTYTRLLELGWAQEDFAGKNVLDIGGSTGILSLYAHKLGAKCISYLDVQKPLADFFKQVVEVHNLPIEVAQKSFDDLNADDARDVVLFMEVLHWIVDQGGSISMSIKKLATLTNETLFLETPWNVGEPSIASRGVVSNADYNIELIIRELHKYFDRIEMVRFMTYFGDMKNSKRILLKATGKKVCVVNNPSALDAIQ